MPRVDHFAAEPCEELSSVGFRGEAPNFEVFAIAARSPRCEVDFSFILGYIPKFVKPSKSLKINNITAYVALEAHSTNLGVGGSNPFGRANEIRVSSLFKLRPPP